MHHEICIAEPTVAVVPVTPRPRGFRNRRSDACNDRARILERAKLQRDRCADYGILPLERNRQTVCPLFPIVIGLGKEVVSNARGISHQCFVRTEHQRYRVIEHELALFEQRGERGVRRQTQRHILEHVANVVAAMRRRRFRRTVIGERPQPQAHAWITGDRCDCPHENHGTEEAPVLFETRRKVDDLDSSAI